MLTYNYLWIILNKLSEQPTYPILPLYAFTWNTLKVMLMANRCTQKIIPLKQGKWKRKEGGGGNVDEGPEDSRQLFAKKVATA